MRNLGIDDETYDLFCKTLDEPSMETLRPLYIHLREMIIADGHEFPNDPITTFLETIHTDGRPAQIRHSYM